MNPEYPNLSFTQNHKDSGLKFKTEGVNAGYTRTLSSFDVIVGLQF